MMNILVKYILRNRYINIFLIKHLMFEKELKDSSKCII